MRKEGKTESKRSLEGIFLALFFCLFAVGGVVLGFKRWLPPLASEHGAGIDRMIQYLMITVGSLFVLGHAVLGYFIWRFSTSDARAYPLPSPKAERNWSLVPVIVLALVAEGGVLVLGLPVWSKFYAQSAPGNAINVEVTGEQFAWNIRPGKGLHFTTRMLHLAYHSLPLDVKRRAIYSHNR